MSVFLWFFVAQKPKLPNVCSRNTIKILECLFANPVSIERLEVAEYCESNYLRSSAETSESVHLFYSHRRAGSFHTLSEDGDNEESQFHYRSSSEKNHNSILKYSAED